MRKPNISKQAFIADGAILRGDVTLKENTSVWFHTTIRAEDAPIVIEAGTNIQDNAVIHVDEGYPVFIDESVTIGHGAIVHGCTIGKNTLIGMGATILNGAQIGQGCIIGAGALIPQNMKVPDGYLVVGVPGKVIRAVTDEEIAETILSAEKYIKEAHIYANTREASIT